MFPFSLLNSLPLHPAIAGVGGGAFDFPGGAAVAGGGDVVDDDIARLARARELELAPRAPPLACGADFSCYRHIVHRPPSFVLS